MKTYIHKDQFYFPIASCIADANAKANKAPKIRSPTIAPTNLPEGPPAAYPTVYIILKMRTRNPKIAATTG